ncbi:hypothetical protein POV27_14855 [Aureisphaera galaxeae]|uniref:hypothetical protein n=1 Tax=Aureisphaera galaxeae TaxID=1538023 RepID=UPI00234FE449|nr:hypothetical protein [Aureisphaera galaxeae]MDC8005340.1 hypothetical protein [Aureisphaera galaxeae]
MKRISSVLTIPYKLLLFFVSGILLTFSWIMFSNGHLIAAIIIGGLCILFLLLAIKLKSIFIDENNIITKGVFSEKAIKKEELKKVGNVFLFFYLQFQNGKKVFFLNTIGEEIKTLTQSIEAVEKDIYEKIKGESS